MYTEYFKDPKIILQWINGAVTYKSQVINRTWGLWIARFWVFSEPSWSCLWCRSWDWDAAGHTWRALAVPRAELALFPSLAPRLSDGRQIRLNVAGLKSLACRTILTDLESVVKITLARSCLQHRSFAGDQIVFHLQLMNLSLKLQMLYTSAKNDAASCMLISIVNHPQLGKKVGIETSSWEILNVLEGFRRPDQTEKLPTWFIEYLLMLTFFILKWVCRSIAITFMRPRMFTVQLITYLEFYSVPRYSYSHTAGILVSYSFPGSCLLPGL